MATVKESIIEIIQAQPDEASYEEIMRELAFERMVERGMEDVWNGRVISNNEMGRRVGGWQCLVGMKAKGKT